MARRFSRSRQPGRRTARRPKGASLRFETLEPRLVLDAGPVINELMAVNHGPFADEDGDFSDWIEIYNPTEESFDLEGWVLADSNDRWTFPAYTLQPQEYLVVFASKKDRPGTGPKGEFHTDFALSGDGEYLGLLRPDPNDPDELVVVHEYSPGFPVQYADVSYGLTQAGDVLLGEQARLAYLVPSAGDAGDDWTAPGYDDSGWEILPAVNASFVFGTEGFVYADDAFGTANPYKATGTYESSAGFHDGGLRVYLGPASGGAASGAWSRTIEAARDSVYEVSLHCRMRMGYGFETTEYGSLILEIDGVRYGVDGGDSLVSAVGDGNGGADFDTRWIERSFLVPLSAGEHTITFGAYNNQSNASDEWVEGLFDDVTVADMGAPGGRGTSGVGFDLSPAAGAGFRVTTYKAIDNESIDNVDDAEALFRWSTT
jgi:hypothetical protein